MSPRRQGNRVPGYRAYGGVLIVAALLNQTRRAYMLVDSGAAYCCITPEIARLLGYDLRRPTARRSIASVQGVALKCRAFIFRACKSKGSLSRRLKSSYFLPYTFFLLNGDMALNKNRQIFVHNLR